MAVPVRTLRVFRHLVESVSVRGDTRMPEISRFFGIVVQMFYADHEPPPFHVRYSGQKALIAIESPGVLRGSLSPRALRLSDGVGGPASCGVDGRLETCPGGGTTQPFRASG